MLVTFMLCRKEPGHTPRLLLFCFPLFLSSFQPRVLLLAHTLIQLLEDRPGCEQGKTDIPSCSNAGL